VLEAVLEKKPKVNVAETPEPRGTKKSKGGNRQPTSTLSEASTDTSAPVTGSRNPPPPPRGRGNNDPPRRARDDTQMPPQIPTGRATVETFLVSGQPVPTTRTR